MSSGVDTATFGDAMSSHFTVQGGGDRVGLGTYASSVLLQVAPNARITSINVFDRDRVSPGAVGAALAWASAHAAELDVVVLAFPPGDVADPTGTALRAHMASLRRAGVNVVVPAGITSSDAAPIQIQVGGITTTAQITIAVRAPQ